MTCIDYDIMRHRPWENHTLAEVAAMRDHVHGCDECRALLIITLTIAAARLPRAEFEERCRRGQALRERVKADPEAAIRYDH